MSHREIRWTSRTAPASMTPSNTPASAVNPLARAFTTIESVGHEHPEYRVATIKMRFEGDGAAERAHAALNYLSRLHEGASPPASAAKGEAVAWRWRFDPDGAWSYGSEPPVDKPPHRSILKPDEVEPLYAQPHPSQQGEGLKTAIQAACDLLAERTYGNAARSPNHNARVVLESALAVHVEAQG